jgi:hypothetical protein
MAMNKLLVALGALCVGAAIAQPAVLGTVSNVEGVSTAVQGATGAVVTPGQAILNGMRFITTSSGTMTLTMNSGCVVTLQPGQAVTVLQSMNCQQLVAAVQPVPVAPIAAAGLSSTVVNGFILAVGLGAAAEGLRQVVQDENLSPN